LSNRLLVSTVFVDHFDRIRRIEQGVGRAPRRTPRGISATPPALSRLRPGRGADCDRCSDLRGNRGRTRFVCLPGFMGLEPGSRYHAEGAALPRRNIVIAVGRRPITGIENVLDIELSAPGLVELQIKR